MVPGLLYLTAQMFLFGAEIDYESGLLESGFKFKIQMSLKRVAVASQLNLVKRKYFRNNMSANKLLAGNWKMNGVWFTQSLFRKCSKFSIQRTLKLYSALSPLSKLHQIFLKIYKLELSARLSS